MTLVVPYDGSALSKTALVRAAQFDAVLDEGVLAITVVPRNNTGYARERGWLGPDEAFDADAVAEGLRRDVTDVAPDAEFRPVFVDKYAPQGTVSKALRRAANEADATIVFLGSENAGRVVRRLTVGASTASDRGYDTMIVSRPAPSAIPELERAVSTEEALE